MAYENVNTVSLKNAINDCRNSLDFKIEKKIFNDVAMTKNWECDSKKNFETAMNKFVNKLSKLDSIYNSISLLADRISDYQFYKNQYDNVVQKIKSLKQLRASNMIKFSDFNYQYRNLLSKKNEYSSKIRITNQLITNIYNSFNSQFYRNNW